MADKVEYLENVLKSCYLPELKQDLDNVPLQSEHFKEYRQAIEHQLPKLYGFIQQNDRWLWNGQDSEIIELHATVLLLLCEMTAPAAIYMLENKYLLQNADKLLHQQICKLTESLDSKIFAYYKEKLRLSCWKRQLGAVHGFMRYLELRHSDSWGNCQNMTHDWLTFCLSVGLNLQECHEPIYKHFSTRIFLIMLQSANRGDILKLNIHSVIYAAVFKNVHTFDTVAETAAIWNALLLCVDFYDDIDSLSWNMVDDMMEVLVRNLTLASDALVSTCLLKFVTKLGSYFSYNHKAIETKLNSNISTTEALLECRNICSANNSYTPFRWAKSILQLFISEAYKLTANPNICRQLLLEIHRCYMVYIVPIPLEISQHLLIPFLNKFIAALMETLVIQKNELDIIKLVKALLETFYWHLKSSTYSEENEELLKFRNSIKQLLAVDIFSK